MMRLSGYEDGVTLTETVVVVAITLAVALTATYLSASGHQSSRPATLVELQGLIDRAHHLAAANGALVQISPDASGVGSDIAVYNSFDTSGTIVTSAKTPELIGASCSGSPYCGGAGGVVTTFALAVRRDGSFDGEITPGFLLEAQSITIGIADPQGLEEGYTMSTTDLHASVSAAP